MLSFKRIIIIFIMIILIIGTIAGVYFYINKNKTDNITEITPEEEISEEQMRQTIVSLYFKTGKELVPEARLIDVKELIDNPYYTLLEMLIDGPKNSSLEKTISEDTKINKIEKQGDTLIIDFSEEFISNHNGGKEDEEITIKSIVNTLTELTEINGIKILINGERNKSFNDGEVNFNQIFIREN